MLDIKVTVNKDDLRRIQLMPPQYKQGVVDGIRQSMYLAEATAKKRMGRPGELQVRSGHLRRSITSRVDVLGNRIVGIIGSNLVYARIHELGGLIKPIKARFLKFQIDGHWKSVKQVRIPARPYLKPSIEENLSKIKSIIINSIVKAASNVK